MRKKKGVTTVIFLKYCSFCKSYRDCWQGTPVGGLLLCCAYLFTTQFHLPYRQKKTPSIYMRRGGGAFVISNQIKTKTIFFLSQVRNHCVSIFASSMWFSSANYGFPHFFSFYCFQWEKNVQQLDKKELHKFSSASFKEMS